MNWRLGKQKILMEANLMTQADPRWEKFCERLAENLPTEPRRTGVAGTKANGQYY